MTEWQPIETAPKDGTRVLLFERGRDEVMETGHYSRERERWLVNNNTFWVVEPAHWMPLPPPPESSLGDGGGTPSTKAGSGLTHEALSARIEGLEKALREIARGEVPQERHGHYLAHRKCVELARSALSSGEGGGDSLSQSQPSGEVSPDGEIFAGQHTEPSGAWRPIDSAPKDGTYVLAFVGRADGRWDHLNGRVFAIRHDGYTSQSGYDMGWSVYPGFGGVADRWFTHWMPLPEPPAERR